jgi:hypothetical protein
MARPHMIVVAGPPGSGKTRYFPVTAFGVAAFNIDDRCAQILRLRCGSSPLARPTRTSCASSRERKQVGTALPNVKSARGLAPRAQRARRAERATSPQSRVVVLCFTSMTTDAELRKAATAHAEVRVFRAGEEEAAADADALYWDRIPMDDRAQFVWQLSLEMHALAHPEQPYDPGLSRSVARVTGR